MSANDPRDPTTWTPGFIAAFNAVRPDTEALLRAHPGTHSEATRALLATIDALRARAEATEAECERLRASRALCIHALRGVPATGSLDEQTWDVVADGIAALLRERDDYRILSNQMHRRAQEAERLLGLAMRVGVAECEAMRARMRSAERELHRIACGEAIEGDGLCPYGIEAANLRAELAALTGPGRVVEAETWLRGIE